ncbi:hypothetical protein IFR04_010162 [Cadophora malorum]|uniref:Uncharacterized protein n=1 Tax=Cadophora malorum TaxID=108018 RepID=A0A8H7TD94_9HELO|nr:hypothetical protein IFR04_010162 [Cadophora malorum]
MYLPQEILTRIAIHCTPSTRANFLTASHATQAAVEEIAWDSTYQLLNSRIPKFLSLYQGHRIRLLRKVVFAFEFPELRPSKYTEYMKYPDTDDEDEEPYVPVPCRETASELKAKDEMFTDQLTQLFIALKIIEERQLEHGSQPVERTLSLITPSQPIHGHICEHRRFSSWKLHLLTPSSLPCLSSIRALFIGDDAIFYTYLFESPSACERHIDPSVVFQLARAGDAGSLLFGGGVVDQTLFWLVEEEGESRPFWPRLRSLKVTFHSAAPSGRWYFQGQKGEGGSASGFQIADCHYPPMESQEGDDEWDEDSGRYENSSPNMFRTKPIDEEVEQLFGAFAKALDVMPVLECAELFTFLHFESSDEEKVNLLGMEGSRDPEMEISTWNVICRWGVRYVTGGANARLEWHVGRWRPSRKLEKLFCRVIPEEHWTYS